MAPVRILYIIERMGAGGTEKQLAALIHGFKESTTVQAHLCTLRPSESFFATMPAPKMVLGIHRLANLQAGARIRRLVRFCKYHRINLVQTFFQDPTLVGVILKMVLPVKLVVSFRDLGFWRNRIENLKMHLAYPWADGFIANSQAVKSHFVKMDKIRPRNIEVIPNGFDCSRVASALPAITAATDNPVIGIVGNFDRPVKRMGDFIQAAALIKQGCQHARFVIVGDGHKKGDLIRYCHALGVGNAVHFTGRIDDPLDQIRQFTVGVNTSASEGFSNAVIEYMACGLPVVVTDVGGNREMVAHGINGFRTPVADPQALAAHVLALLRDPALRCRMGAQNIKTVQTTYALETMITAHESFYTRLIVPCEA